MTQPAHQIAQLVHRSLTQTIYDVKWLPGTAKFVALGCNPRGTGVIHLYELDGNQLELVSQAEQPASLKCGGFGASADPTAQQQHLAVGDHDGQLHVVDVERLGSGPVFSVQAHGGIVNALDVLGQQGSDSRLAEVVTCGKDGGVRVWDMRQPHAPAAAFLPAEGAPTRDCWCVALGNAGGGEERCVLAGYENGDVRMFDLRTCSVRWETNVGKGVCSLQFDRPDIPMNKFVGTCMESQLCLWDARTQHPTAGFAGRVDKVGRDATLWQARHLPQNRDVFMVTAGDGSLTLHKYRYPDQRAVKDPESGQQMGVAGSAERVCDADISCQPVSAFDWSADKAGVFVAAAFDQTVRVGVVTRISSL